MQPTRPPAPPPPPARPPPPAHGRFHPFAPQAAAAGMFLPGAGLAYAGVAQVYAETYARQRQYAQTYQERAQQHFQQLAQQHRQKHAQQV